MKILNKTFLNAKLVQRKYGIEIPINCKSCGKVIPLGEYYYNNGTSYEWHKECHERIIKDNGGAPSPDSVLKLEQSADASGIPLSQYKKPKKIAKKKPKKVLPPMFPDLKRKEAIEAGFTKAQINYLIKYGL